MAYECGGKNTPLTPQEYHPPMGSSYSAILYCPRTGSTWYAILLQSKCQMYWLIWGHGTSGTAAVAHSARNQLLHWLFNKELLALLHKQAELWTGTLSSSSMNLNEGGAILNGGQLKALLGVSNVMIHHPPHLQQASNTRVGHDTLMGCRMEKTGNGYIRCHVRTHCPRP